MRARSEARTCMSKLVIRKARLLGEDVVDIAIEDGLITAIGADLDVDGESIDATDLIALPCLVVLHTHVREPGR